MERHFNDAEVAIKQSGKLERSEHEEPRGELERAIAKLWQHLFHADWIGRNDNFFELGGNSLLAMDLSEMFDAHLALEVPVLMIFQHPTVGEIAQVIASQ